jgi:cob(I)alamin adenosyltransferase
MRTIPQVPSTSWWARNQGPELTAYEAACPAWRDGMGLAFCVEFAPQNLAHTARTVLRRATRTATRLVTRGRMRPLSQEHA